MQPLEAKLKVIEDCDLNDREFNMAVRKKLSDTRVLRKAIQ